VSKFTPKIFYEIWSREKTVSGEKLFRIPRGQKVFRICGGRTSVRGEEQFYSVYLHFKISANNSNELRLAFFFAKITVPFPNIHFVSLILV